MLGYAANKAITVVSTIALARLLAPVDFGLVAIAGLVIGAIALFTSAGFGNAVILRQDLDRQGLAAALGLMLAIGVGGTVIGVLAAPLVAQAFDAPAAEGVLAVSAALLLRSPACPAFTTPFCAASCA